MKTYTKEQIVEAFKSALPNSTALGRLLTHLESLCGARNTSSGCSEVACTRTVGHADTIPGVAQERHYNHERRVNWPVFKVGDRVRVVSPVEPRYYNELGWVESTDADRIKVRLDFTGAVTSFHTEALGHVEAPAPPQFKAGDRVRLVRTDGLGKLEFEFANKVGCIVAGASDISDDRLRLLTVRFDGKIRSFFAWRFDVVPESKFKPGDRVRWKLSSSLPFCHGQVEYLSNERAGVWTGGQFVEVAERLLEADPQPAFRAGDRVELLATGSKGRIIEGQGASGLIAVKMESGVTLYLDSKKIRFLEAEPLSVGDRVRRKSDNAWSGVVPPDPANYQAAKPQFKAGDRVKWKGTTQTGTVSAVRHFGKLDVALDNGGRLRNYSKLDVALDNGGRLRNYSPDGFEPAEPRTFIKHFLERVCGQEFTHEEAELLRTHIAIRERTPKPTELRCPFCGGTGSLSRNGNLWRLECIGCGAEVTAAANEDCKSKWERRN